MQVLVIDSNTVKSSEAPNERLETLMYAAQAGLIAEFERQGAEHVSAPTECPLDTVDVPHFHDDIPQMAAQVLIRKSDLEPIGLHWIDKENKVHLMLKRHLLPGGLHA